MAELQVNKSSCSGKFLHFPDSKCKFIITQSSKHDNYKQFILIVTKMSL